MTYELEFSEKAWKEWRKLGSELREQFKNKLVERLANPHVPAARLKGLSNAYKIKTLTQVLLNCNPDSHHHDAI
ncbi:hypothetical protein BJN42_14340 [Pseudomonas koreensis]|nr:hypothetical protein BJN42_14340 [Pseudomonas koreensis]